MTRMMHPLAVADISTFAKSLKKQLDTRQAEGLAPPSHLELLNLLAHAAGFRNFQTFKAIANTQTDLVEAAAPEPLPAQPPPLPEADTAVDYATLSPTVRKALMQFDTAGRLVRLPNKLSVQRMAMWWMWSHFTVRRKYTEKEVNQVLNAHHTFGDQATLRREMVNMHLLGRKSDCSEYWKEPLRPSPQEAGFLRALRQAVVHGHPVKASTVLKRP